MRFFGPQRAPWAIDPLTQYFTVPEDDLGVELDEFLCRLFPLARKRDLRRLVREGAVTLNGAAANPSARLRADDVVSCDFDEEELEQSEPPATPQDPPVLLYEDEHMLVLDKPADLLVEPDRWDEGRPNLIGALHEFARAREARGEGSFRPRLVHRLDKDTSGVLAVAKTVDAERVLGAAFEKGEAHKQYLALVEGEHPLQDGDSETIDLPLGPDGRRSGHMCVRGDGKPAQTRIRVAERFRGFTLLECEPLTGRTHQIRVHLAAQGFPLIVDPLYGRRKALLLSEIKAGYRRKPGQAETPLIARLTLHARALELPSVAGVLSGAATPPTVRVEAVLPPDFERARKQLAKWRQPRR